MIASIRLKDFKNFADETLRLGPFTVIVGANASGKSNIRDAFRFLHGIGRGYLLPEIASGAVAGLRKQTVWEQIRGAADGIVRFGKSDFMLDINFSFREGDINEIRGYLVDSTTPAPDKMNYAIRVGRDIQTEEEFSLLSASFRADTGYEWERPENWSRDSRRMNLCLPTPLDNQDRECIFLTLLLHRTFRDMRFFDPVPNRMRQPSFPDRIVLGDDGENLSAVLQKICADANCKATLIEWIQELTPMDVRDFEFPTDPSGRVHLVMREKGGRRVSADGASDGTLRFLATLAAFLGPKPSRLYFIEEIENGIHPSRLHLLLDLIETQTEERGIQVVATTHSPALLTAMGDRTFENTSVVCRLPDTDDSIIRPLRDIPNARDLRKEQGIGRLLEGGWMERALYFTEAAE